MNMQPDIVSPSGAQPASAGLVQRVLPWAGVAVVVVVSFSLGVWQLGRAQQKLNLQAEMDAQRAKPELRVNASQPPSMADRQRLAGAEGRWLPQASVFLENRPYQGQAGFWLVTPLRLGAAGDGPELLVVRGWAPRDVRDRTLVPQVPTPQGVVSVQGRLGNPPSALSALGAAGVETSTVRLNLDMAAYAAQFQLKPLPVVLWQLEPSAVADGLVRDWFEPGVNTAKHYGYAVQWFGIGLAAVGLMLWHRYKRKPVAP